MSRALALSFLGRRMRSSRALLGCVMLTAFLAASLLSALATFGVQALPQAAHRQLARSQGTSVVIIGLVNAGVARADGRAIRGTMQAALGHAPYNLDGALWSDPLKLLAGRDGATIPAAEVAAPDQVRAYSVLVDGGWPGSPRPGQPVPAAIPAAVADQLRLAPGALLVARDRNTGTGIRFRVSGVFRQRSAASPYWGLDAIWTCSASTLTCFTRHGPMVVSPAAFGPHGLAVDQASWAVLPEAGRIPAADLDATAARISRAEAFLQHSERLGGLLVSSSMPQALRGASRSLAVARSLLVVSALELLLLAGVALALAGRLLTSHREEESALLHARGAARWQLAGPAVGETVLIGAAAAAAGVLAGSGLAALLTASGPLHLAGLRVSGVPLDAWWAALPVLALCAAATLWSALRPPAPGTARAGRGRQAAVARAAEAGGDLALIALAVIAVWELRTYSIAAHTASGAIGIDPVLAVAPALALAGISLIPLRALPVLARIIDRATATSRRLGAALAGWEISRRPVRQSGPVLLAVLAVATATLTLAQYQSWHQSAQDQAAFAAGADVRVGLLTPVPPGRTATITHAPGVTAAMPVSQVTMASAGELLALDARSAPATAMLRADMSPLPAAELWRRITPGRPEPALQVPGRPARLQIVARLAPGSAPGMPAGMSATLSIQDAVGTIYRVPVGTLPADGRRHPLIAELSPTRQATYPVRLAGLSLTYQLPAFPRPGQARSMTRRPAMLTVSSIAAGTAAGAFAAPFADGSALSPWRPAASSPDLANLGVSSSGPGSASKPAVVSWRSTAARSQLLSFRPGHAPGTAGQPQGGAAAPEVAGVLNVAAPPSADVVPGIATRAFLRASRVAVGAVLPASVGPDSVRVKIVAAVAHFPTVTGAGGALIVDQATVQELLASQADPPLPVTSWWLRTATGAVPPGLPAGSAISDRAQDAAALLSSPLSDAPQQAALAIAAAAALLAIVGFSVSVAASLRARRRQSALLAALGVSRPAQAGQLCLEELMLSLPAAAAGLLAGAGLARLLIPAVTLTPAATIPVPPVLVVLPLGQAAWLALAVTAIPVLVAGATIARRADPAAQLRAAETA